MSKKIAVISQFVEGKKYKYVGNSGYYNENKYVKFSDFVEADDNDVEVISSSELNTNEKE